MSKQHGPQHRTGTPSGPGCPVTTLPITLKTTDGSLVPASLLDVGRCRPVGVSGVIDMDRPDLIDAAEDAERQSRESAV